MRYTKHIIMIGLILFASLALASSLQETPISYIQKVTYEANCGTTCQNISTQQGNASCEYVNCTTTCEPILEIGLMFTGDDDFETITIDTAEDLYKNNSDFIIPGTYMATLGNTSDVTGLNEKIINLSTTVNKQLASCFELNIELESNHSKKLIACNEQKNALDSSVSQKITQLNEMEKYKGQRLWFTLLGIALGIGIFKWFLPWANEFRPKRDPTETQHSPYTSQ